MDDFFTNEASRAEALKTNDTLMVGAQAALRQCEEVDPREAMFELLGLPDAAERRSATLAEIARIEAKRAEIMAASIYLSPMA